MLIGESAWSRVPGLSRAGPSTRPAGALVMTTSFRDRFHRHRSPIPGTKTSRDEDIPGRRHPELTHNNRETPANGRNNGCTPLSASGADRPDERERARANGQHAWSRTSSPKGGTGAPRAPEIAS